MNRNARFYAGLSLLTIGMTLTVNRCAHAQEAPWFLVLSDTHNGSATIPMVSEAKCRKELNRLRSGWNGWGWGDCVSTGYDAPTKPTPPDALEGRP